MAQIGDVAARLAEGQRAVDTFAELVLACGQLGYRHPDLTAHLGQVHDWYAAEDGLDLRALDADGAALAGVAGSAERALRLQDDQLTALAQAWQGAGAQTAHEFLLRHGGAAQEAVVAVRRAVGALAELRDQLWRAIDGKVTITERIEARCAAHRDAWLAAARIVRTGPGRHDVASELIDTQVKPFVDNDIGVDWVSAMRSASTSVSDAYAAAITELTDGSIPVFEIPGDLGPSWLPRMGPAVPIDSPVRSGSTVPAGFVPSDRTDPVPWVAPASPMSMPPAEPQITSAATYPATLSAEPAASVTGPAASDPAAAWGASPLGGGLPGAGLSGIGSGLSGIGQQLADLFGGLLGSTAGGSGFAADTATPEELDEPEVSDPVGDEDTSDKPDEEESNGSGADDKAEDVAPEDDSDADGASGDEVPTEDEVAVPAPEPAETPVETGELPGAPQPAPPTVVPPAAPAAPAEPMAAPAKTPCEIAADELPQVGG
ncbi:hypothetical protein [Mycobacterium sp. 141]|uniref:hypothetical protein n=1 Tax=Mycobacterium sp. 141 TaxID=1120797 RepID=UPI0003AA686F|nr:hypothetical protein [Mycobacterium sp. 141]